MVGVYARKLISRVVRRATQSKLELYTASHTEPIYASQENKTSPVLRGAATGNHREICSCVVRDDAYMRMFAENHLSQGVKNAIQFSILHRVHRGGRTNTRGKGARLVCSDKKGVVMSGSCIAEDDRHGERGCWWAPFKRYCCRKGSLKEGAPNISRKNAGKCGLTKKSVRVKRWTLVTAAIAACPGIFATL